MPTDYNALAEQLERVAAGDTASLLKDEDARRRLLVAMQKALPEIESFQDTCQRLFLTPLELAAAQIGCDLKLFETLDAATGPMTTEELAKPVGADPALLDRLLKYIASLAMIREVGERTWAASRTTRTLAQPSVAGGVTHYFDTCGPAVQAFPQWLADHHYQAPTASNTPFTAARNGQDIMQWIMEHPANIEKASQYMTIHRFSEGAWIKAFPFDQVDEAASADPARKLFVDVAGGFGHQCKALLEKRPAWNGRVVLEEIPPVLEKMNAIPGLEVMPVDMFTEQPVKGAKIYYLRSALHDWPDERCLVLLGHIKAAMAPDSLLIVDESIVPARGASKITLQIDLIMLLCLAASERSEQQWHELLHAAGFTIEGISKYHDQDDEGLIFARAV